MQTQLPFMDNVNEFAFVEVPKGAGSDKKTGTSHTDSKSGAFFKALQSMTQQDAPCSEPGSKPIPHASAGDAPVLPAVGKNDRDVDIEISLQTVSGSIESIEEPAIEVPGIVLSIADGGADHTMDSKAVVDRKNEWQPPPTVKVDDRSTDVPAVDTAASGDIAVTTDPAGQVENGGNVNSSFTQPASGLTGKGPVRPWEWSAPGSSQGGQVEVMDVGQPEDPGNTGDPQATRWDTNGISDHNRKNNDSPELHTIDSRPIEPASSSAPETPVETVPHSKETDTPAGSSVRNPKDLGWVPTDQLLSGDDADRSNGEVTRSGTSVRSPIFTGGSREDRLDNSRPWLTSRPPLAGGEQGETIGNERSDDGPEPADGEQGGNLFTATSEPTGRPAPVDGEQGGNPDKTRSWPADRPVTSDMQSQGRPIHTPSWSAETMAENRENTQSAVDPLADGPTSSSRNSVVPGSTSGLLEGNRTGDSSFQSSDTGEVRSGAGTPASPPVNELTENRKIMAAAAARPAEVSQHRPATPFVGGPTAGPVELRPAAGLVSDPSESRPESSSRKGRSSLQAVGSADGENQATTDSRWSGSEKPINRTMSSTTIASKVVSAEADTRSPGPGGSDQGNETVSNGKNDQGSIFRSAQLSSGPGIGPQGQGAPGTFSSGQVIIDAAAGGDTVLSEGQSPQENTPAIHSQDMGKGEQPVGRTSETQGRSGADLPEFFPKMVDRAVMTLRQGQSEMKMVLKPEFLGQIRMQVTTENQHVIVKIVAETQVVKEVIENNLGQLKSDMQSHGLQVDEFDVMTSNDSPRNGQNTKHFHTYRGGSKTGEGTSQNPSGDGQERPASIKQALDASGNVDFFA